MINREREFDYVMIQQHNHAFLSGELATNFKKEFFKSEDLFNEVITAVYEHDRGWISLDESPIWNDEVHAPFSFADYPLTRKLTNYKIGIDEVQKDSLYASLLCSLHYCSFFSGSKDKESIVFLKNEEIRQLEIKEKMKTLDDALLHQHFRLLQVCDDLSLYACLNEPGVNKENEHRWFVGGISKSEFFNNGKSPLYTEWLDEEKIRVRAFPFYKEFQTILEYKVVSKSKIKELGIKRAFTASLTQKQKLQFVGE